MHEQEEAFPLAREERQAILDSQMKLHGEKSWKTVDARLNLAFTNTLSRLTRDQRKRLRQAEESRTKGTALYEKAKYTEAIAPFRQSLETRRPILEEKSYQIGQDYFWLGLIHWRLKERGISEAYCQAAPWIFTRRPGVKMIRRLLRFTMFWATWPRSTRTAKQPSNITPRFPTWRRRRRGTSRSCMAMP